MAVQIGWVGLSLLLAGCGMIRDQTDAGRVSIRGVQPTVEQIGFADIAAAQDRLILALQTQAQLADQTLGFEDRRWSLIMKAGIQLVNGHCDQYLDALFRFDREQRAAHQGLAATSAATSAIMGLTNVAGTPIAIVATAFGLAGSLFDASVGSVLFQIEPSALRNIVIQGRQAYLDGLVARTRNLADITTRPDVMIALQGYLTQCSPAAIEANINNAANGSPFAVTQRNVAPGTSDGAIATGTPAVGLVGRPFVASSGPLKSPNAEPARDGPSITLLPGEASLTIRDIRKAQAALGVAPVTGDPGPAGSRTRQRIEEFQQAMRQRDGTWPSEDIGTLAGSKTRGTLITIRAMPPGFRTPFERFLLGNKDDAMDAAGAPIRAFTVLDTKQMKDLRERLGLSATPPEGVDWWDGVRPALAVKRVALQEPGPEELDAKLYAKIRK